MANFGKNYTEIAQAEHISPGKTGDSIEAKKVANYNWNGVSWQRAGVALAERYDYSSSTTIYTATAPIGTADSASDWTIIKYDLSDPSDVSGKVAVGGVWDDRATETYV